MRSTGCVHVSISFVASSLVHELDQLFDAAFQIFSVKSKLLKKSEWREVLLDGGLRFLGPNAVELDMSRDRSFMAFSDAIEEIELVVLLRQVGRMRALDALNSGQGILHALKCFEPLLVFLGSCRG